MWGCGVLGHALLLSLNLTNRGNKLGLLWYCVASPWYMTPQSPNSPPPPPPPRALPSVP